MARRRRKHSKRRHRRVGAMSLGGKSSVVKLASVAAGFLMGSTINAMVDKVLPKDDTSTATPKPVSKQGNMIGAVGEVGIGGLLLLRKSGGRGVAGTVMTAAGGVLLGAGLKRMLKVMGVISGYQSVPVIGRHRMAGYQSVPVIGGNPPQLSGRIPPQLAGYQPAGSGVGAYTPAGSGVVMGSIGGCDDGSGITNPGTGYMS